MAWLSTTNQCRVVLVLVFACISISFTLPLGMSLSLKSSSLGRGMLLHRRHPAVSVFSAGRDLQHSAACQQTIIEPRTLSLTPDEEAFFTVLKQVVVQKKLNTAVRVAGGWVRDKLLSLPGNGDIDIALDNITGLNFVAKMNEWIEEHGQDRVRFGVIQPNHDKSKHLQTVSLIYGNCSIDFVNLRTESYTSSSRIPRMAIGTPEEDAFRRDLTINALFYNIHTHSVEDFTKMGLSDLQLEMVRTPLEPLITLTDDPLRALRIIRFACRFNFNIASDLLEACGHESVHASMLQKISKERISAELDLMLKTPHFARAIYLLYQGKLWQTVMRLPPNLALFTQLPQPGSTLLSLKKGGQHFDLVSPASEEYKTFHQLFHKVSTLAVLSGHLLTHLEVVKRSAYLPTVLADTFEEAKKKMFVFSLATIFASNYFTRTSTEKSMSHISEVLLLNNLKLSTKDINAVNNMHWHVNIFMDLLHLAQGKGSCDRRKTLDNTVGEALLDIREGGDCVGEISRLKLGLAITEMGANYAQTILFAAIMHATNKLVRQQKLDGEAIEQLMEEICRKLHITTNGHRWYPRDSEQPHTYSAVYVAYEKELEDILGAADTLFNLIDKWQLQKVWADPPLVNGKELVELLPNLPNKNLLGGLIILQKKWKLCRPDGTKDELRQFLRDHFQQYV